MIIEIACKVILGVTICVFVFLLSLVCYARIQTPKTHGEKRTVCFFHPDLGIGGAERLVIDAALGLNEFQHCHAIIVTTSYDPRRCFTEVKPQFMRICNTENENEIPVHFYPQVIVCGNRIPRGVCGRFVRLCAMLSMTWAVLWMALYGPKVGAYVVDQVPFTTALLRLLYGSSTRIVFYCHFPDFLCNPNKSYSASSERGSFTLYSKFFNSIEKCSMGYADSIMYNSHFTQSVAEKSFGKDFEKKSSIVHPAVRIGTATLTLEINDHTCSRLEFGDNLCYLPPFMAIKSTRTFCIVAVSRFEPKKNHILALEMLEELRNAEKKLVEIGLREKDAFRKKVHLVLAGGYDSRLVDNVTCMRDLYDKIHKNRLKHVSILPNISDNLKWGLLHRADAVVFTAVNEHFGIVPLEAMACGKPVVASNTGGLCDTIGYTSKYGILVDPHPQDFALAILSLMDDAKKRKEIGQNAQIRAESLFSIESLAANFGRHIFAT